MFLRGPAFRFDHKVSADRVLMVPKRRLRLGQVHDPAKSEQLMISSSSSHGRFFVVLK